MFVVMYHRWWSLVLKLFPLDVLRWIASLRTTLVFISDSSLLPRRIGLTMRALAGAKASPFLAGWVLLSCMYHHSAY